MSQRERIKIEFQTYTAENGESFILKTPEEIAAMRRAAAIYEKDSASFMQQSLAAYETGDKALGDEKTQQAKGAKQAAETSLRYSSHTEKQLAALEGSDRVKDYTYWLMRPLGGELLAAQKATTKFNPATGQSECPVVDLMEKLLPNAYQTAEHENLTAADIYGLPHHIFQRLFNELQSRLTRSEEDSCFLISSSTNS